MPAPCLSRLSILLLAATLCGCASTGDWREDTIFFDRRMAEERLAPKRGQLADLHEQTAAERIRETRLRGNIARTRFSAAADRSEITRLRQQRSTTQAALTSVEADLDSAQTDAAETVELRRRRDELRREVNRLDTLLADLLDVKQQRYPR